MYQASRDKKNRLTLVEGFEPLHRPGENEVEGIDEFKLGGEEAVEIKMGVSPDIELLVTLPKIVAITLMAVLRTAITRKKLTYMAVFIKEGVEIRCGLDPAGIGAEPLALLLGAKNLDDIAFSDGVLIHGGGTDFESDGLTGCKLVQCDGLVFIFAVNRENVVVGGSERRVLVLEIAKIIHLVLKNIADRSDNF